MKFKNISGTDVFPFTVAIDDGVSLISNEIKSWCSANFELGNYSCGHYTVWFKLEQDRNWFILRWS